jgi:hypothetical protein
MTEASSSSLFAESQGKKLPLPDITDAADVDSQDRVIPWVVGGLMILRMAFPPRFQRRKPRTLLSGSECGMAGPKPEPIEGMTAVRDPCHVSKCDSGARLLIDIETCSVPPRR